MKETIQEPHYSESLEKKSNIKKRKIFFKVQKLTICVNTLQNLNYDQIKPNIKIANKNA